MARTLGKHALVLLLITQIQFSHFSNAQETQPELCYQVAWGVGSTYRRHVIRPVTAFPAEHALVTEQYCGGKQAGWCDLRPPPYTHTLTLSLTLS